MFISNVLSFDLARIDANIIYQLPRSSHSEKAFPVLYTLNLLNHKHFAMCS